MTKIPQLQNIYAKLFKKNIGNYLPGWEVIIDRDSQPPYVKIIIQKTETQEILAELFDSETSFALEWDDAFAPQELHALAYDRQGRVINISFVPFMGTEQEVIDVEFTRGGSHDITGKGDAARVLGTVINAVDTYLTKYNKPTFVLFSGKGDSRFKLYSRLIARYAGKFGYQQIPYEQLPQDIKTIPGMPKDVFALIRQTVSENFKDDKKPGRKGLAKRMGVNCKASVSTLRRVAKNSSGEKQRMAHWCANMKSGRKE